jgi:hypothetical protein
MADLEDLIPTDMLAYATKQGLLLGIVLHPPGNRKRNHGTSIVAAAMIEIPMDGWEQPRPSKRFRLQ